MLQLYSHSILYKQIRLHELNTWLQTEDFNHPLKKQYIIYILQNKKEQTVETIYIFLLFFWCFIILLKLQVFEWYHNLHQCSGVKVYSVICGSIQYVKPWLTFAHLTPWWRCPLINTKKVNLLLLSPNTHKHQIMIKKRSFSHGVSHSSPPPSRRCRLRFKQPTWLPEPSNLVWETITRRHSFTLRF